MFSLLIPWMEQSTSVYLGAAAVLDQPGFLLLLLVIAP